MCRFSQGATVAAAMIVRHQALNPFSPFALFKYGIFFSGRGFAEFWGDFGIDTDQTKIQIPTLHVLGVKDPMYGLQMELAETCSPELRQVVTHELGHCVPKKSSTVQSIVSAIEHLQVRSELMV
jgi:predicted esterase